MLKTYLSLIVLAIVASVFATGCSTKDNPSSSQSQNPLVGVWIHQVPMGPSTYTVTWKVNADGTDYFTLFAPDTSFGTYTISGNQVTVLDPRCPGAPGTYSFTISGDTMQLAVVSDSGCSARVTLTSGIWTRPSSQTTQDHPLSKDNPGFRWTVLGKEMKATTLKGSWGGGYLDLSGDVQPNSQDLELKTLGILARVLKVGTLPLDTLYTHYQDHAGASYFIQDVYGNAVDYKATSGTLTIEAIETLGTQGDSLGVKGSFNFVGRASTGDERSITDGSFYVKFEK